MNYDEPINTYTFEHHGDAPEHIHDLCAKSEQHMLTKSYVSSIRWPVVLNDFMLFLSGIYGYDVSKHVMIMVDGFRGDEEEEDTTPNFFMGSPSDWEGE